MTDSPLTRRAERWADEARRLRRINAETHVELHSLECLRDDEGTLVCVCRPIIEGDEE